VLPRPELPPAVLRVGGYVVICSVTSDLEDLGILEGILEGILRRTYFAVQQPISVCSLAIAYGRTMVQLY
jgi:hypothetical protein